MDSPYGETAVENDVAVIGIAMEVLESSGLQSVGWKRMHWICGLSCTLLCAFGMTGPLP